MVPGAEGPRSDLGRARRGQGQGGLAWRWRPGTAGHRPGGCRAASCERLGPVSLADPSPGGRVRGAGKDLVFDPPPTPVGWELRGPHTRSSPTADGRGGPDRQPAAPSLRPHREAAPQAAPRLQHPLPVQGPRPAANVRGECVRAPHSGPCCLLPPGPGSPDLSLWEGGRDEGGPAPPPPASGFLGALRPRPRPAGNEAAATSGTGSGPSPQRAPCLASRRLLPLLCAGGWAPGLPGLRLGLRGWAPDNTQFTGSNA